MPLVLSDASLDWALKHALRQGDTDLFPVAFEFKAISDDWDSVKQSIQAVDLAEWTVRAYRRCLAPKHRFGFRVSTQLDPLDFLVFTALIFDVGKTLEAQRIPVAEKVVHSYRFSPDDDGRMYSADSSYRTFQDASKTACDSLNPQYVVVADIADFFPRIYGHRLDNALDTALGIGHLHSQALKKLVAHWAGAYSYGIPVGSASSRILAELTINDVDQLLLSEGSKYVRYSDDFRIFCQSEGEAYQRLTLLARTLFENHGLTLQQNKTRILPIEEFRKFYLHENDEREVHTLSERFYDLLEQLGIDDPYGDIDFDELDEESKNSIRGLNLLGILREQVIEEEPDLALLRFLLRRFGQLDSMEPIDTIFDNFQKFVPVIRETIEYLLRITSLSADRKRSLGARLLEFYQDDTSAASSLEYTRMYLLHPFSGDVEWNSVDKYVQLFNEAADEFSSRELMLAMGRGNQHFWMRGRKQYLHTMPPWLRRAYIYAASCLPADEYKHWIRGIHAQLDPVERAIAGWARANPIGI
jgi:hypothetical protein